MALSEAPSHHPFFRVFHLQSGIKQVLSRTVEPPIIRPKNTLFPFSPCLGSMSCCIVFFFFLQLEATGKTPPSPKLNVSTLTHSHCFISHFVESKRISVPIICDCAVHFSQSKQPSCNHVALDSHFEPIQFQQRQKKRDATWLLTVVFFISHCRKKEIICFEGAIILTFSEQVRYSILLFVITLILSNSLQDVIGFNKQPMSWRDVRRTSLLSYQATKSNYSRKNDKTHFIPSRLLPALCYVIKLLTGLQVSMYIYVCTNSLYTNEDINLAVAVVMSTGVT